MLDQLNTLSAVQTVLKKLDEVNALYITKVAEQIKAIGEMNATSLDRLTVMTEMGANITDITRQLSVALHETETEVMKIYQKALDDVYNSPRFRKALEYQSLTPADFRRINTFTEAVSRQTVGVFENYSNTTEISVNYHKAIDRSILAVSSGLTSYTEAMRDVVREIGEKGIQVDYGTVRVDKLDAVTKVEYASGWKRRLDSAVRQNIIDGANQISGHCADIMGEALGYDAVRISAHANSAPDHEPVQGRIFLRTEFDKMQSGDNFQDVDGNHYEGFRRPINQWNCGHFASPVPHDAPRIYSDEELADFIRQNHDMVEIDGKKYTKYQCSQIMRRLETESRRQKDIAVAAKAAGDMDLRRQCQRKINAISAKYGKVADAAGLRERRGRMTVQGFKAVKAEVAAKK